MLNAIYHSSPMGYSVDFPPPRPYDPFVATMTRKSIESAAKGLIVIIFLVFLYSVYRVMEMMSIF
jgi:hypothetical protein